MVTNMGGATLSSSGSSSAVHAGARAFDVGNEHDLLELLQFIRRGPFSAEEKSAFRDTVLDYSTGHDTSVLTGELLSALRAHSASLLHNGVPLAAQEAAQHEQTNATGSASAPVADRAEAHPTLGAIRPAPAFGPTAHTTKRTATETPAPQPAGTDSPAPGSERSAPTPQTQPPVAPATEPAAAVPASEQQEVAQTTPSSPPAEQPVHVADGAETTDQVPAAKAGTDDQRSAPSAIPQENTAAQKPNSAVPATAQQPPEAGTALKAESAAAGDPLERIKEIKRQVNEKVGNPVNLIDANNEVGREYMNALLNAMRVANGGNPDEAKLGMERLEKAFAHVQETIRSGETVIDASSAKTTHQQPPAAAQAASASQSEKEPAPSAPSNVGDNVTMPQTAAPSAIPATDTAPQPPANSQPQRQEPTQDENAEMRAPVQTPKAPSPTQNDRGSLRSLVEEVKLTPKQSTGRMHDTQAAQMPQQQAPAQQQTPKTPTPSAQQEPKTAPPAQQNVSMPVNTQKSADAAVASSLADRLREQQTERKSLLQKRSSELQMQQSAQEAKDPLYSNEVSAGLQQLLSEWKLFKSSGIFGTGPSGYEHPLYKTISALPMAAVIAGRFEGAAPEVKQSIADYMNGWRYEHGVVHEMNETFEHYLRRVVKEILDRRKNAPKA